MTHNIRKAHFGMLFVAAMAAGNCGCGGGAAIVPPPPPPSAISVSMSQATATVQPLATAQFTATVSNDASGKGVTWSMTCNGATCGSVSPAATASGAPMTYTAPGPPGVTLNVVLTATSVADTTKTASASISVPSDIAVQFVTSTATVQVGTSASFQAKITNDPAKKGVTWTVSCSAPSCGSVSPATSTPDLFGVAATTYTAPSSPTASNLGVTLTATSVSDPTKSATATITIPNTAVSIAPGSVSVPSGGTQQFTATVTNDPSNSGATWEIGGLVCRYGTFTCSAPAFHPCGTACGTLGPSNTASGQPTTYTAPSAPPNFIWGSGGLCSFTLNICSLGTFIRATSVKNTSAFALSGLAILPISVSVSVASASVAVNGTQQFIAAVVNDGTSSGVTWTLTQKGAVCSPGCGTVSPTSTASGTAATYTAPAGVPPLPVLTVTATSVEDTTKSASATITVTTASGAACGAGSGSESTLKGQYAVLLQGFFQSSGPDAFVGTGGTRGVVAITGSLAADGTGKITGGEEDINNPSTEQTNMTIDPAGSSYSVGPDHRGCLALAISGGGTTYFRFSLGALSATGIATAGDIIEFDDTTGTGARAAGTIRLQDPTSFTASQLKGNYAIGLVGADAGNGRLAVAGTFALDGNSAVSSAAFDIDDAGTAGSLSATPGGSFACCSANGRGALMLQISGRLAFTPSLAFYMISGSDLFLVNSAVPHCTPGCNSQYGGEAIGIAAGTTFSQASLNGSSVARETAQSSSGPVVDIATVNADGKSALTVNDNINSAGTFSASSTALNYSVASNGRVTFAGGSTPPVIYLYGPNQGFLVGTDPDVTFGILEPQAAGPFSDASFSGAYTFGTETPLANTVTVQPGVLTADGSRNATGTSDQSSPAGLAQNQSLNFSYSFPANGIGNVGSGTTAILISDKKLVFINNTTVTPTITVVEK